MCEVVIYEQDQDDYYLLQMLTIFLNKYYFLHSIKKYGQALYIDWLH